MWSRNDKIITELKGKINMLEGQLLEKDDTILIRNDTIRSYKHKFTFMENKIADIEKELKDQKLASDEKMRLKDRVMEKVRCQMEAAEVEKTRLEGIVKEMRLKESEAVQSMAVLRRKNEEAFDVNDQLIMRVSALESQILRYEEIVRELKESKDHKFELDEEMRLKEIKWNRAMDELRRANLESLENLRCQMEAAEMENTRLERIVDEMRQKDSEAVQNVEVLTRRNKDACDVNDKLIMRVSALESQMTRYEEILKETFQAGNIVEELPKDKSKARDDTLVLSNRVLRFETRVSDIENELKDLRLKKEEAYRAMKELRRQNLESIQNTKMLTNRVLRFETIVPDIENELGDLRLKKAEAYRAIEELRRQNLESIENTKTLRCQMLAVEAEKSRLEEEKARYETVIEKIFKDIKEAKDAGTSFSKGSISADRASNVLLKIDTAEAIDNANEAIPGDLASNSELCLGEQENILSCPSSLRSGLLNKRKRSPGANGDDN